LSFDGLWQENEFGESAMYKGGSWTTYKNIVEIFGVNTCKVMIPPQSHRGTTLKQNYKWFVETFGMMNPDFTLVRDDVWYPLEVAVFKFEIKDLADQVIKYIKEGIETMPGIFSLYILDTLAGEKYGKRPFGCFAGLHGLGFMPDGKAYPCARFGSAVEYEIFDSFAEDGFVEWNAANCDVFLDETLTDPRTYEKCKKCVLYKYCNAGCTYSQLENGGILDSLCELYKASYEQAFRIVDELKDNGTFKKIMSNLTRRLE
jgi:radical SAM protein with 4Fe4S-binding SPASM domain